MDQTAPVATDSPKVDASNYQKVYVTLMQSQDIEEIRKLAMRIFSQKEQTSGWNGQATKRANDLEFKFTRQTLLVSDLERQIKNLQCDNLAQREQYALIQENFDNAVELKVKSIQKKNEVTEQLMSEQISQLQASFRQKNQSISLMIKKITDYELKVKQLENQLKSLKQRKRTASKKKKTKRTGSEGTLVPDAQTGAQFSQLIGTLKANTTSSPMFHPLVADGVSTCIPIQPTKQVKVISPLRLPSADLSQRSERPSINRPYSAQCLKQIEKELPAELPPLKFAEKEAEQPDYDESDEVEAEEEQNMENEQLPPLYHRQKHDMKFKIVPGLDLEAEFRMPMNIILQEECLPGSEYWNVAHEIIALRLIQERGLQPLNTKLVLLKLLKDYDLVAAYLKDCGVIEVESESESVVRATVWDFYDFETGHQGVCEVIGTI